MWNKMNEDGTKHIEFTKVSSDLFISIGSHLSFLKPIIKLCNQVEFAGDLKDKTEFDISAPQSHYDITIWNPAMDKLAETDHLKKVVLQL